MLTVRAGQVAINTMNVKTRIVPLRVSLVVALISSAFSAHASFTISYGTLPVAPSVQLKDASSVEVRELPAQADSVVVPSSLRPNSSKGVHPAAESVAAPKTSTVATRVYAPAVQSEVEVRTSETKQIAVYEAAPASLPVNSPSSAPAIAPSKVAQTTSKAEVPSEAESKTTVSIKETSVDKPDEVIELSPPVETWIVSPVDGTLRVVLNKWAAQSGWQISWEASVDLPLTVSAEFYGDFKSAVKQLFTSLSASDVNLNGLLYTGNNVLRVTEVGRRAQ